MLVLKRYLDQAVVISVAGVEVRVVLVKVGVSWAELDIIAPDEVVILREELTEGTKERKRA